MSWSEYEAYLQSYHEQKQLEEYQQQRVLPRPHTTKWMVAGFVALWLMMVGVALTALWALSPWSMWVNVVASMATFILAAETYGRFVGVKVVECYQHYADDKTRRKCKCVPSCSEYAILCLEKYELVYSLLKIRKRLFVTCKGFDYIIDNP